MPRSKRPALRSVRIGIVLAVLLTVVPGSRAGASAPEAIVIQHGRGVRFVDPSTGEGRWQIERVDSLFATVTTDGVAYVSEAASDGTSTAIGVVDASGRAEMLAELPGRFAVGRTSASGDHLLLMEFPSEGAGSLVPVDVRALAIPAQWRAHSRGRLEAVRDNGVGILAADGRSWYQLRALPAEPGSDGQEYALVARRFEDGSPTEATKPLPLSAGYHSLLASPATDRLYLVSYYEHAFLVVDSRRLAVVQTVPFGTAPFKHALCAAALSPTGDRLFVLANSSSTAGDGIRVFDTASWSEVAHLLPGQDLYCLVVAPDGSRLYTSTVPTDPSRTELLTIDAQSGDKLGRVPLDLGFDWVAGAVG